jgi:ASC-1-like (ASCH) protein
MDHVAIMKKSWGLIPKILSGEKTIESRWYKNKSAPWGKIKVGDVIYFRNTGEKVSVRVRVRKVLSFENLNSAKTREILDKYGEEDGIEDKEKYFNLFKDKKYCLLIFLDKPESIEPFEINKKGFGAMAAWISTNRIDNIKSLGSKNGI